jgi:hypothetical protein
VPEFTASRRRDRPCASDRPCHALKGAGRRQFFVWEAAARGAAGGTSVDSDVKKAAATLLSIELSAGGRGRESG